MKPQQLNPAQAYLQAQALQQQGHLGQAAQLYQWVMQHAPKETASALQLARILVKTGQDAKAQQVLASRSAYAQNNFDYLYMLAALSLGAGQLILALESANRVCELNPRSEHAQNLLGSIYLERNDFDLAISAFLKAVELKPDFADPHNNLAWAYRATGQSAQAIEHFEQAYKLNPSATEALSGLLMLKRFKEVDHHIALAEQALKTTSGNRARTDMLFALGKAYEDCGDYCAAQGYFEQGNQLWRSQLQYHSDLDTGLFKQLRLASYPPAESTDAKEQGAKPIFVVGMPRSSTSLVEQILASHSEVSGAGEITLLANILLSGYDFTWSPERLSEIRTLYLDHIQERSEGKAWVVDKMPQNFRFIGVIRACFPEAKIIHCERDARDNCLSLYKHHFPMTQHNYAYDIQELRHYHQLYRELMRFWNKQDDTAQTPIFALEYEHLIEHFEEDVHALLAHIGLDFEESCLHFQKTKRAIRTASSEQVRRGLYKSGAGQWRHYQDSLADLFKGLPSTDH